MMKAKNEIPYEKLRCGDCRWFGKRSRQSWREAGAKRGQLR